MTTLCYNGRSLVGPGKVAEVLRIFSLRSMFEPRISWIAKVGLLSIRSARDLTAFSVYVRANGNSYGLKTTRSWHVLNC